MEKPLDIGILFFPGMTQLDVTAPFERPAPRPSRQSVLPAAADRFETVSWTARKPIALAAFQTAIGQLAPHLLRAKGFVTFAHEPDRPMLFQLVGSRATIVPSEVAVDDETAARIVLIAESGRLDAGEAVRLLDTTTGGR